MYSYILGDESQSSSVMSNQIRDLVGTDRFLDDSTDFEVLFVLVNVNVNQLKSSFDIIQDSEGVSAFGDFDHVHESNWVFGFPSDFIVHSQESFLLTEDLIAFGAVEGQSKLVSENKNQGQGIPSLVGTLGGSDSVSSTHFVDHP